MCCPKASCASDATACCPTASANNCCPWHARCSPNRVENHCFLRPCLIAHRGTAPDAEKPCASSNASPLHNSISQPSILHLESTEFLPIGLHQVGQSAWSAVSARY